MSQEIIVLRTSLFYWSSNMSRIYCSNFFFHVSGILVISSFWGWNMENASLEFLPKHISSNLYVDQSSHCSSSVILKWVSCCIRFFWWEGLDSFFCLSVLDKNPDGCLVCPRDVVWREFLASWVEYFSKSLDFDRIQETRDDFKFLRNN